MAYFFRVSYVVGLLLLILYLVYRLAYRTIIGTANWLIQGVLGALFLVIRTPRVIRLLLRPSTSITFTGGRTAWQQLLGAALRPHTLLIAAAGMLGPGPQQFVGDYIILMVPTSIMVAVSALSLISKSQVVRPLLSQVWTSRQAVLQLVLVALAAVLEDHVVRVYLSTGRLWTGLLLTWVAVGMALVGLSFPAGSDDQAPARRRQRTARLLHVAATAHCTATSVLLVLEAYALPSKAQLSAQTGEGKGVQNHLATDCLVYSLLIGLASVESWGLMCGVQPLTSLVRAAVHIAGPSKQPIINFLKNLHNTAMKVFAGTLGAVWDLMAWMDKHAVHLAKAIQQEMGSRLQATAHALKPAMENTAIVLHVFTRVLINGVVMPVHRWVLVPVCEVCFAAYRLLLIPLRAAVACARIAAKWATSAGRLAYTCLHTSLKSAAKLAADAGRLVCTCLRPSFEFAAKLRAAVGRLVGDISDEVLYSIGRLAAPFLWPVGGGIATWLFVMQAVAQRKPFPFLPAAYACAVCTLMVTGHSLRKFWAVPGAVTLGFAMSRLGAFAYRHLDLGAIRVASVAISWATPLVRRAMAMTRSALSGAFVAIAHVADAVLRGAVKGVGRLAKALWSDILRPLQRRLSSAAKSSVLLLWNSPVLGLAVSLAFLVLLVAAHKSGLAASAWHLQHRASQQVAADLAHVWNIAAVGWQYARTAGNFAWFVLTKVMHGTLIGSQATLTTAMAWGHPSVDKVLSQPSFALSFYLINLLTSVIANGYILPPLLSITDVSGQRWTAVHAYCDTGRLTFKALLTPLYFLSAVADIIPFLGPRFITSTLSWATRNVAVLLPLYQLLLLWGVLHELSMRFRTQQDPAERHWPGTAADAARPAVRPASSPSVAPTSAPSSSAALPGAAPDVGSLQQRVEAALIKGSCIAKHEYPSDDCTICLCELDMSRLHRRQKKHRGWKSWKWSKPEDQANAPTAGNLNGAETASAAATSDMPASGGSGGEDCVVVRCGHIFHTECIAGWCCRNGSKASAESARCPVCRELVFPRFSAMFS